MPNMSYCRFQNTIRDLQDCNEHITVDPQYLSREEAYCRRRIIELCREITDAFEDHDLDAELEAVTEYDQKPDWRD